MDDCVIPTLETERLRLRPFRRSDFDDYAALCADPEVMRWVWDGKAFTRETAWRHFAFLIGHWHVRGVGTWAVEAKADGSFLGRIGFFQPEGWPGLELTWILVRRAWGQGYATEGARAALDHAFTAWDQAHVISLIQQSNHPSIRVAERLGESLEGSAVREGREYLIYGIARPETGEGPAALNR